MKNAYLILLGILFLVSCSKEDSTESRETATLEIRFLPSFNGEPLQFNTPYTKSDGETFTLTALKFYTGQFSMGNSITGYQTNLQGDPYYLVDFAEPATTSFSNTILPGNYNLLSFLVGVDSARNVSGVQSGALDPGKGMFWTWNSGYIYLKMEGFSPLSSEPNQKIEYHIGGFQVPTSAIRQFVAELTPPDTWELTKGKTISFDIEFAVDQFFDSGFSLKIAETPVCATPGELASKIADNMAGSFSVSNFFIH